MEDVEKNLAKVKGSRAYKSDPDNREYISDLEKDLENIKTDAAFIKLDKVQEIKSRIKSVIVSIRQKLIEEDNTEKRLSLKADLKAYMWLLRFFARDVDREMAEINNKLMEKIEEI